MLLDPSFVLNLVILCGILSIVFAYAYEIPQLLNILLKDKKYAFCIALGCIIKGETPHFDIISQSVSDKLLEISMKYNVPVSNGVLNCNTPKQAEVRCDPKLKNKGGEAVLAALSVYNSIYKR